MSEIRIHALRNPQLAAAYLAQEDEMRRERRADHRRHRARQVAALPAARPTRPPGSCSPCGRARRCARVMAGLDYEEMCRRTNAELARVAQLIIDAPER